MTLAETFWLLPGQRVDAFLAGYFVPGGFALFILWPAAFRRSRLHHSAVHALEHRAVTLFFEVSTNQDRQTGQRFSLVPLFLGK
jgi:hypothetical protein